MPRHNQTRRRSMFPHRSSSEMPAVGTLLTAAERRSVDAAGLGSYQAIHRDGVNEILGDIKQRRVDAVLISVARCGGPMQSGISSMVREFPRIAAVALVSGSGSEAARG